MPEHYTPRPAGQMLQSTAHLVRPDLDPATTAVVIIDMINADCLRGVAMIGDMEASGVEVGGYLDRVHGTVVPNLDRLLDACRSAGARVVWVNGACYSDDFTDCVPQYRSGYEAHNRLVDSWENELVEGLRREPGDLLVHKAGSGGFASSLDLRLRNMGIRQVVYTGVVTNGCVLLTVTAGFDLGYHGWFVSDATATFNDRLQGVTEEIISSYMARVVSTDEMIALVGADRAARSPA